MNSQEISLLKEWAPTLDAKGTHVPVLSEQKKRLNVAKILDNQQKWENSTFGPMTEANGSTTGDLGVFRPILMPVTRRLAPSLLANQIVGVQPMTAPTGQAFAYRVGYAGANGTASNNNNPANQVTSPLSLLDRGPSDGTAPTGLSAIVIYDEASLSHLSTPATDYVAGATVYAATNATTPLGVVKYKETSDGLTKLLIQYTDTTGATPISTTTVIHLATSVSANLVSVTPSDVVNNETMYNVVLHKFAGGGNDFGYTTAQGEALAADMPTMKSTLESVTVTAKTRKLKAEFSIEMAQDLQAVHNIDAEAELMNAIQTEIAAEIDRELLQAIRVYSTGTGSWVYGQVGQLSSASTSDAVALSTAGGGLADGRDELSKFRTLYTRIVKESNEIAKTTRKGAGNFIIVSIQVLTALQALGGFSVAPVNSDLGELSSFTNAGTLEGRFQVYVDTLNYGGDYCVVGYKGPAAFDTGIVYCPYVPVMLQKTVHEQSFQPVIGAMTRSAIAYNLQGTKNYYRSFTVNLQDSQLG